MNDLCKNFLKGLLFGTVCVCLLALCWLLLLRPQLTRQQTQALKAAYTLPAPQAESLGSGSLLGQGKESPAIDLASLQAAYPDVKAWLTVPGTQILSAPVTSITCRIIVAAGSSREAYPALTSKVSSIWSSVIRPKRS